jgi:predicted aspartyl protease
VPRLSVPGEAPLVPRVTLPVVRNVTLATEAAEVHLDAVIDTGSTLCIVPPFFASQFGFDYSNRLEGGPLKVIGGGSVETNVYMLESVQVGSAKVYEVKIGVQETFDGPGARTMLVGQTFIKRFRTIFDFDSDHVIFRPREPMR